jgi:hypothetical protein
MAPGRFHPIDPWRTSAQTRPRRIWTCGSEPACRPWRDRSALLSAHARYGHQAPADRVIPDNGQHAAVQNADLLACLRPHLRTSFHHQPEAQHPKNFTIHKNAGRLPHLLAQSGHANALANVFLQEKKRTKIGGTISKIHNGIQWDRATKWDNVTI